MGCVCSILVCGNVSGYFYGWLYVSVRGINIMFWGLFVFCWNDGVKLVLKIDLRN